MTWGTQQPVYAQAPQPTNGLGLAGFIVSLAGWVTCGVLCPIGFVMSCIGVFREPRGFAVAGIIVGLIGSVMGVVFLFIGLVPILVMMGIVAVAATALPFKTLVAIGSGETRVHDAYVQHGTLPTDAEGNRLLTGLQDQWGHDLRYHQLGPTRYEIRSEGPDGRFDTPDDMTGVYAANEVPTTEEGPATPSRTVEPVPGPEAPAGR